ncbi:ferric reductase transmembrane component 4 [Stachybotrys elegans]|uniref:Ferric reductase transmembrane component 4 n=1 Tax=Stachybotrys elegans TaxID=80388 RepID=A0A8K0WLH6_9HYPO|nr:ferric reductase transmembrane component 4 [Stachybotrys elegans]
MWFPTIHSLSFAAVASLLLAPVSSQSTGRPGHGLIGYGITMYQPACAHACRGGLPRSAIPCHTLHHGHHSSSVSSDCLAMSEAFLLSAAWCLHTRCMEESVPVAELEKFWRMDLVGRELVQPMPMWTYEESLHRVRQNPPTQTLAEEGVFNETVLVDDDSYIATWNGNSAFEAVEANHNTYGLVIIITCAGIPIFLSLLRLLPFPALLTAKFYAYLIDPPAFGKSHAAPILGLGIVPTRGQALFIFYIIALNVILSSVGYNSLQPHSWYTSGTTEEIINYVANRTGVLSFANLALVMLYAGRNNILLWVTNWSHSTFLLVHRWVALICMLQAVVHSALWLHLHVAYYNDHDEVASIPYWYWGIIATLCLVLLIPLSALPIRQKMYEVFHAMHIVLAVIAVVGSWYHIIYRYQRQWGYEVYIIIAISIWAFDWAMRGARILGSGIKTGYVTRINDDYIQLDVPGALYHGHAYAYFPTLTWRIWESHPFSVAGVTYGGAQPGEPKYASKTPEASTTIISSSSSASEQIKGPDGARFLIRVEAGTTSHLAKYAGKQQGVPLLLEAYSGHSVLKTARHPSAIFIAGGVGITAILPHIASNFSTGEAWGSKKLYWGLRSGTQGLANAVQEMVGGPSGLTDKTSPIRSEGETRLRWGDTDVHISVGEKMNLRALLEADVAASKGGVTVVVCGPPKMADEVRLIVSSLGRHGAVVELCEESFMW